MLVLPNELFAFKGEDSLLVSRSGALRLAERADESSRLSRNGLSASTSSVTVSLLAFSSSSA
jgi:hypothetical protein